MPRRSARQKDREGRRFICTNKFHGHSWCPDTGQDSYAQYSDGTMYCTYCSGFIPREADNVFRRRITMRLWELDQPPDGPSRFSHIRHQSTEFHTVISGVGSMQDENAAYENIDTRWDSPRPPVSRVTAVEPSTTTGYDANHPHFNQNIWDDPPPPPGLLRNTPIVSLLQRREISRHNFRPEVETFRNPRDWMRALPHVIGDTVGIFRPTESTIHQFSFRDTVREFDISIHVAREIANSRFPVLTWYTVNDPEGLSKPICMPLAIHRCNKCRRHTTIQVDNDEYRCPNCLLRFERLYIFPSKKRIRGFGLFTATGLKRGATIGPYTGEVINGNAAVARYNGDVDAGGNVATGGSYLFQTDYNYDRYIDSTIHRSFTAMVNNPSGEESANAEFSAHAPTLTNDEMRGRQYDPIYLNWKLTAIEDTGDPKRTTITLVTTSDVPAGGEILASYNNNDFSGEQDEADKNNIPGVHFAAPANKRKRDMSAEIEKLLAEVESELNNSSSSSDSTSGSSSGSGSSSSSAASTTATVPKRGQANWVGKSRNTQQDPPDLSMTERILKRRKMLAAIETRQPTSYGGTSTGNPPPAQTEPRPAGRVRLILLPRRNTEQRPISNLGLESMVDQEEDSGPLQISEPSELDQVMQQINEIEKAIQTVTRKKKRVVFLNQLKVISKHLGYYLDHGIPFNFNHKEKEP